MPLGRFISTLTVSLAATTSTVVVHSLSASPDFVWATQKYTIANITNSNHPIFAANDRSVGSAAHTQSVTLYNKGQIAGTWTVCIAQFWSPIR